MSTSMTKRYMNSIFGLSDENNIIRIGVCCPFHSIEIDNIREWWFSHNAETKLCDYSMHIDDRKIVRFYHSYRLKILEVIYINSTNDFVDRDFDVLLDVPCDWYKEAKNRLKTGGLLSLGLVKMNETDFLYDMMKETWVYGQWPEYKCSYSDYFDTDVVFQKMLNSLYNSRYINKINLSKEVSNMDIRNNIKDVIFNGPATIIKWTDGTKTVVKCQEGDADPWVGMAMAISKKVLGNKGNFNEVFKKWIKEEPKEIETDVSNIRCVSCFYKEEMLDPCTSCINYDKWEDINGKR